MTTAVTSSEKPRSRRLARLLVWGVAAVATIYVLLSGGLYWAMRQTPDAFGRVMAHVPMVAMIVLPFEPLWMQARAGRLDSGADAPDFQLPLLDHSARVKLSSFRGSRPVVLVFGSYT